MRRLLLAAACSAAVLLGPARAFAQTSPPPIVVVDVSGDRLDAARTRDAIGRELSAIAVSPDDPRAAEATGRIEVAARAKDRALTVTYRKLDAPVSRTVELPDDPARAESAAVFLAGNVARDEASDLVPAPSKPAAPAPKPTAPSTPAFDPDERDLAQMRAFINQSASDEHAARMRAAAASFAVGAAVLAPTIYFYAADDPSDAARLFRVYGAFASGALLLGGVLELTIESAAHEPLARKLEAEIARGAKPVAVVSIVEKDWERRAELARAARQTAGWIGLVSGGVLVGLATGMTLAAGPHDDALAWTGASYVLGTLSIFAAIGNLSLESPVESSYRAWRTLKPAPPSFAFGAAPAPGGGMASFALRF